MTTLSGTGSISRTTNPLYTTSTPTTAAGFVLQSGSPARDVGTATTAFLDYAGNTRPQNGSWDMGAFEFVTSVSTTLGKAAFFFQGGP